MSDFKKKRVARGVKAEEQGANLSGAIFIHKGDDGIRLVNGRRCCLSCFAITAWAADKTWAMDKTLSYTFDFSNLSPMNKEAEALVEEIKRYKENRGQLRYDDVDYLNYD